MGTTQNYYKLNWKKSKRQLLTKRSLTPISKAIQVRRIRHAGRYWRNKDELISNVLLHMNVGGFWAIMNTVVSTGHEFKSWTRLFVFYIALISLGKIWIQLFSLQLWLNSRDLLPSRSKTLNSNLLKSAQNWLLYYYYYYYYYYYFPALAGGISLDSQISWTLHIILSDLINAVV